MPRKERESLTILDYSDREFLLLVVDCYDGDGWAAAKVIGKRLNLVHHRSASSRLSWLTRFGAVEREYKRREDGELHLTPSGNLVPTQRWRLT
jgi:hypothetical protein